MRGKYIIPLVISFGLFGYFLPVVMSSEVETSLDISGNLVKQIKPAAIRAQSLTTDYKDNTNEELTLWLIR
jgi:hypothetical protein